jgi:toxin ParE1/3/4
LDARVRDEIRALWEFPELGRIGRVAGTRELILPHDRCVIVYEVLDDVVRVLRVIHGGQLWFGQV